MPAANSAATVAIFNVLVMVFLPSTQKRMLLFVLYGRCDARRQI
jgi:hypothetical protein